MRLRKGDLWELKATGLGGGFGSKRKKGEEGERERELKGVGRGRKQVSHYPCENCLLR